MCTRPCRTCKSLQGEKVVVGGRKLAFVENLPWAMHLHMYTLVTGFSQQASEMLVVITVMRIVIIIISWV